MNQISERPTTYGHPIRRRIVLLLITLGLSTCGMGRGAAQTASQEVRGSRPVPLKPAEAHLGRGYEALKLDRYEDAVSEFRAALAIDPKLVLRARFPLAVALFEEHKAEEAHREFETVEREAGEHPNSSYYLGRLDLESRAFKSAIRNLSKAAVKPPFPDTAYYLGFACFKQGDLAAAEKWLKKAAELTPSDARVPYQLGLLYRKEGHEVDAKKAFELSDELRRRDDADSKLRSECAQKLDQGQRADAYRVCEQLYDPDNAERLTALGTIYGQHSDLEAALRPLRRAAELAPESPQMQYNLALTYYRMSRFEEARAPLAKAIQRWPDLFQLNSLYGAVLSKLGEDMPAYQALRHAYQLNPEDSGAADLLYVATFAMGRKSQIAREYPDSLRYFAEAAKLRPREPEPHSRMAEIYALTGRSAEAAAEQREVDRLSQGLEKSQ